MARVQKTRGAPFGTSPKSGRAAAVAGRILASHNRTIPRLCSLGAAPATVLQPCATDQITKRRAALLQTKKAAASNFAPPAQVDTMRQTVLALAICGHAAALQPARAPRQSLAVRQAPRGVRQRVLDGVRVETRESRRHRLDGVGAETRERIRHRRDDIRRRAATPTARPARPSTRRRRSRTRTIRWIKY